MFSQRAHTAGSRRPLVFLLALCLLASIGRAHAARLLLDAGRDTQFWQPVTGAEFPGASSDIATATDPVRGACVHARLAFARDSQYAGVQWRGEIPNGTAVGFWVRLSDRQNGGIRILDATEQWHAGSFTCPRGEWAQVEVPLTPEALRGHWGGANDGLLHFPLRAVLIAANRKPDAQEMSVSNLYVETAKVEPAERWRIVIRPGVSSGVALAGEKVRYSVQVINRLGEEVRAQLAVSSQAPGTAPKPLGAWEVTAGAWEQKEFSVALPSAAPGYWCVRAALSDAKSATRTETASALTVVPRPRHYGQSAPDCYFGLQGGGDIEAAERLGAKAYRFFVFWKYTEGKQGEPRWEPYDPGIEATAAHHMETLLTADMRAPGWAVWQRPDQAKAREIPDPSRLEDWAHFVRQIVERYRGKFRVIEMENEPDLTCGGRAGLSLPEGVDYYTRFLRAGREAVKAVDPHITVSGSGVSGVDLDRDLPFTHATLDKSADAIDLYTGHPYASPRNFGPGQHPKWPVANLMAEKCRKALDEMAAHGRPRRMWIGELGWALRNTSDPLSQEALDWSACVTQSLIVGKSVPGVEKYLYFTLRGCNEGGYEYGLTRGDPSYPLPGALAYSAAAYFLDDTKPVALAQAGPSVWRASFASERRNELVVAWWADEEGQAVRLAPGAPKGRWVDCLYRTPSMRNGRVTLGRLPVFWILPLKAAGAAPAFLPRMAQIPSQPVQLRRAFLTAADRVTLEMANHTGKAQALRAEVQGQVRALALAAGEGSQRLQVPLATPLPTDRKGEVRVTVSGAELRQSCTLPADLLSLPRPPAGFAADGDLSEWQGLTPLRADSRQSILPPDPTVGWEGPQDLSFAAHLAADARGLYFACEVTDNVHAAPAVDANGFWTSDSIQFAIDPENDSGDTYDGNDRELGLVLAPDGPRVFRDYPNPAARLNVPAAIRRVGTKTIYEALFPWETLGIAAPQPGRVLAINFIVNDNDGAGRGYWMGLTPGIGEAKNPLAYRRFVVSK